MMDFSGSAGAASSFDNIPENQLAFAVLTVRGTKNSASGGGYLDCELVIDQGQPYAGRKIWDMIGDPNNAGNSEAYRQMGMIAITRILEAGRGAGPNNLAGYKIDNYQQLSGLKVAIKVGIEKGSGGHDDKNRVKEYLTPNPQSQSGYKGWEALISGKYNTAQTQSNAPQSGFGDLTRNQAGGGAPASGFGGSPQGGQGAQPTSGFQQQQGNPAPAADAPGNSSTGGFASTATTSHSDPAATPGWLAQAGTPAN